MILAEIAAHTRQRVATRRQIESLASLKSRIAKLPPTNSSFAFAAALRSNTIGLICEIKKASPSKGIIAADFPYLAIAKEYERAGAAAISVLTEPDFFLGKDNYLTEIKQQVNIPVLRKDFIIDEYQIYESKLLGADAILLIAALLDTATLQKYICLAHQLGLSALVEAHDITEIRQALQAGARIIGVNNRNLKDFSVNINNSLTLRQHVPNNCLFIAESGISNADDLAKLQNAQVNGALIGEALMRSNDKIAAVAALYNKTIAPKVKICGLSKAADIATVNAVRPDYAGFVFAPSHRQLSLNDAYKLKQTLDASIKTVGVFVNESLPNIQQAAQSKILDLIQLHGDESEAEIQAIKATTKLPIIKACRLKTAAELNKYRHSCADYLLFDTFSPNSYGGTGQIFNWNLLENINRPFFLAGGLSITNVAAAFYQQQPYCLDISSGVETNGSKDPQKITEFINLIRRLTR